MKYSRCFVLLPVILFIANTDCKKSNNGNSNPNDSSTTAIQTYRPYYHFSPASTWTNDPNGLVYYQGLYHLFFQENPSGIVWGNMSWGHATSTDLLSWKQQPVAIPEYTDSNNNTINVFSGTAVVDSANSSGFGTGANMMPLIAIYTSNGPLQNQSLAYSPDGSSFTRYAHNPILDIQSTNFRDPKVFWYAPTNQWIMIVSMPIEEKVRFYSSANLVNWQYLSDFGAIGNTNQVWECPDIFPLQVQGTGQTKWVVTVSGGGVQTGFGGMQYFVGNFDGVHFVADALNYPLYLDYGKDFYAGITYNDLPAADGRRIMIGWANNWAYAGVIPTLGFRGMMSIPRNLQLLATNSGSYILTQLPVAETDSYKGTLLYQQDSLSLNSLSNPANGVQGDALNIEFTMERNGAAKSGINVFKNGSQETSIYYNSSDNTIKLDRTNAGNSFFSSVFSSIESAPAAAGSSDLQFRILIDKSIVEVFVNNGEQVITDQVFPLSANGGIEFFSQSGSTTFKNINVWKMNPSMD